MTLANIRTQLLSHFLESDTFFSKDLEKIKVNKELEDSKKSMVQEALKDLEANKIVKKLTSSNLEDGDVWILESKLDAHGQQVYLSLPISSAISETINTFIEANKLGEEKSNPLNLSERDIGALLGIINELLEDSDEENDEKEES